MTQGEAIAAARRAKGLKQHDLASLMGLGQSTISKWERGRAAPTDDDMDKLAIILGASVVAEGVSVDPSLATIRHVRQHASLTPLPVPPTPR